MPDHPPPGPRKFRKRPVVIEACQYGPETCCVIAAWMGEGYEHDHDSAVCGITEYAIQTLEGEMYAAPGDWIIKGVQGEFYPCKPDIFEATYEPA